MVLNEAHRYFFTAWCSIKHRNFTFQMITFLFWYKVFKKHISWDLKITTYNYNCNYDIRIGFFFLAGRTKTGRMINLTRSICQKQILNIAMTLSYHWEEWNPIHVSSYLKMCFFILSNTKRPACFRTPYLQAFTKIRFCMLLWHHTMRVYPKVSGLATWSENCKWYSSLPLGAVVLLFCESV
jgi:hypothetical protein